MALVELINTPTTDAHILDDLETFVTSTLGKGVVRAKDTPNFIANRVGVAGMLATMKEVQNYGLSYDVVDDLTGKKLGRASSGTFRTADVVGLDTMAHVIKTLQDNLRTRAQASVERSGKAIASGQLGGEDLAQALCLRADAQAEETAEEIRAPRLENTACRIPSVAGRTASPFGTTRGIPRATPPEIRIRADKTPPPSWQTRNALPRFNHPSPRR